MGEKRIDCTPIDKPAEETAKVEQLDLETHARLEAGLIDSLHASDTVSATQPARTIAPEKRSSSLWQAINRVFRKPVR